MGKSSKHDRKSKKKHKNKKHKEKKKSNKLKKHQKEKSDVLRTKEREKNVKNFKETSSEDDGRDFSIPVELMNSKSYAPETPEEYQQRQSRIRREVDPCTGRSRLIKGDGEILEEIVSKERHKAINKEATKGDGNFFEENTLGKLY